MNNQDMNRNAFSIVELLVVVVVLGIVAAMAIPQFSQAAVDQDQVNLKTDLAVLRTAIEMYYHDHGAYPGQKDTGDASAPAGSPSAFVQQLTLYSDAAGCVSEASSARFRFGPYLHNGIPPCPVSVGRPSTGFHLITGNAIPAFTPTVTSAGWVFNVETGYLAANSPGMDKAGTRYDTY